MKRLLLISVGYFLTLVFIFSFAKKAGRQEDQSQWVDRESVQKIERTIERRSQQMGGHESDQHSVSTKIPATGKKGLTWAKSKHIDHLGIDLVSCYGRPRVDGTDKGPACNPYQGDTPCDEYRPILCIQPQNLPRPPYEMTGKGHAVPYREFYRGWSGGHIGITSPIQGKVLTSLDVANQICEDELGPGYRMAEHGDSRWIEGMDEEHYFYETWPEQSRLNSGGWHWYAYGDIPNDTRFWVHINDQAGNCWGFTSNKRFNGVIPIKANEDLSL